jgi:hypothetical protein
MPCFGGADLQTLYLTTVRHGRPDAELARYPDCRLRFLHALRRCRVYRFTLSPTEAPRRSARRRRRAGIGHVHIGDAAHIVQVQDALMRRVLPRRNKRRRAAVAVQRQQPCARRRAKTHRMAAATLVARQHHGMGLQRLRYGHQAAGLYQGMVSG